MSSITVTESLAAGLSNRFFKETQERTLRNIASLQSRERKTSWPKMIAAVRSTLNGAILAEYEGGTKRHPYFAFDVLDALGEREYNTWNEKSLTALTVFLKDDPQVNEVGDSCYSLGEHAVRRIFLRTPPVLAGSSVDVHATVIRQLRGVPVWANFWLNSLITSDRGDLFQKCHPILPAQDGLFLAEFNSPARPLIEVRTFVDVAHLSEEQRLARQLLLEVMPPFVSSPVCFSMAVNRFAVDHSYYLYCCFADRVLRHPLYPALLNTIFRPVEGYEPRRQAKVAFERHLQEDASKCAQGPLNETLDRLGVGPFMTELRKAFVVVRGRNV